MQQRLLQFVEGGEFSLVEGFEVLGFGAQIASSFDNFGLNSNRREHHRKFLDKAHVQSSHDCPFGMLC